MKNNKGFAGIGVIIAIIIVLVIGGGVYLYVKNEQNSSYPISDGYPGFAINLVGNDRDEHGCNGSAGYSWCAVKNKCLRVWEEKCESAPVVMMDLILYVQDKEVAAGSDCGATKKIIYQVPKTTAFADASLKVLFSEELSMYGVYKSVSIVNGVAKIILESDKMSNGAPMSSLSSCQGMHLGSVLNKTLTQYSSIKSIKLYSPEGAIEF